MVSVHDNLIQANTFGLTSLFDYTLCFECLDLGYCYPCVLIWDEVVASFVCVCQLSCVWRHDSLTVHNSIILMIHIYDFGRSLVEIQSMRLEKHALTVACQIFFDHTYGWIASILGWFLKCHFISFMGEALDISEWITSQIHELHPRFITCLRTWCIEDMYSSISNNNKYDMLLAIKPWFATWFVSSLDIHFTLQLNIIKFLLSDHYLEIKSGHWHNIPYDEWFCSAYW